jgi:hypothetical protein
MLALVDYCTIGCLDNCCTDDCCLTALGGATARFIEFKASDPYSELPPNAIALTAFPPKTELPPTTLTALPPKTELPPLLTALPPNLEEPPMPTALPALPKLEEPPMPVLLTEEPPIPIPYPLKLVCNPPKLPELDIGALAWTVELVTI